jgi:hypothetical protein
MDEDEGTPNPLHQKNSQSDDNQRVALFDSKVRLNYP